MSFRLIKGVSIPESVQLSQLEKGVGRCVPEGPLLPPSHTRVRVLSGQSGGGCSHSRGSREWRRKRERRERDRAKSGRGPGAASPWAGLGQVLGASAAGGGGEERGLHPVFAALSLPSVPPLSVPCPHTPRLPVALSNLGRKRFQKAQVWARSPRRTSNGFRFRLTYCCAPVVYGGHCGDLESRGSLGSLRKEGEISACPEG